MIHGPNSKRRAHAAQREQPGLKVVDAHGAPSGLDHHRQRTHGVRERGGDHALDGRRVVLLTKLVGGGEQPAHASIEAEVKLADQPPKPDDAHLSLLIVAFPVPAIGEIDQERIDVVVPSQGEPSLYQPFLLRESILVVRDGDAEVDAVAPLVQDLHTRLHARPRFGRHEVGRGGVDRARPDDDAGAEADLERDTHDRRVGRAVVPSPAEAGADGGPGAGRDDAGEKPSRLGGRVRRSRVVVGDNDDDDGDHPLPRRPGVASRHIKHVIFINKENATHDLLLGDITATRRGVPVDGDPAFSLGPTASPNHHELALRYSFGDNFFLEPSVSSDGHRWLTNTYTTEFEETHWPASYGGARRDAGDDPEVIANYPGRIGFTDANSSPEPNDYNEHGGIYAHLVRHGRNFVNFGNGFEFAIVDEDFGTEPTGIREHTNIPMEKVVRDRTDHLFPEYNTHIPDSPLPEAPDRFNRFGRFQQVFEAHYVDRRRGVCKLPSYVDLYYPNDHGGGANDINPQGPEWDFTRFVQDNDAALGRTVDLISKSPCWKDTVIFVVEDDTQNGLDHVDGHRSIFLAISPWVKREHVVKTHLSLASIFKTVDIILGIPPLNQNDAAATDLRGMFTNRPDLRPYDYIPPAFVAAADVKKSWKRLTRGIDFSQPDRDEVRLRLAIQRSEGLPHRRVAARR